ncbi:hypothetical protein OS493_026649 [Desmophyllum pertusum]|uniref:G-protein coupled receptors family 1 profile domain-containing protein n=1 Tax=Desmophyllum pertusum TaxID=174260 RepID=A0A9W9Y9U6_9CNID|nr:hypothetical protein OS493_026649 [Desmophyllum pertusum]
MENCISSIFKHLAADSEQTKQNRENSFEIVRAMNHENSTDFSVNSTMNLSSGVDESGNQIKELTVWKIFQVFAYYFAIFLSLVGNAVVIKAIKRIGRTLRRKVHYLFIVNLSVADLLFAVENIPIIYTHLLLNGAWHVQGHFGAFLCQFDVFPIRAFNFDF